MIPALLDTDVSAPVRLTSGKVRCNLCCLQEFCDPDSLTRHEIDFLKTFVKKQELQLRRGEQLYRQGDEFRALFAVHTGSFKVCVAADDGKERVTGFSLAGDMMGLDAIDAGRHGDYAVALEDGGVCLLPWERLEEAAARMPLVRRQVMRMLSREVRREQELSTMRGHLSAEQRFAAFLLSLSRRLASRGFDGERFRLTMSRPDIGDFLGLTAETVSRLFTRFRDAELIQVRARDVELLRTDALRALIRSKN